MLYILESIKKAFLLIAGFDKELLKISWTSIWIAGSSTILTIIVNLPLACIISTRNFSGKRVLIIVLNTLMSLPTVVVGLLVYSFLCRRGPLGHFGLLYTPLAMIIGQFILASPIVLALIVSALEGADKRIEKTALALGATRIQSFFTLIGELRVAVFAAIIAGFGRVFAEVGVSMMLGGNIKNYTRNITTAIAFETAKGEFSLGLALGMILLFFALVINLIFQIVIGRRDVSV